VEIIITKSFELAVNSQGDPKAKRLAIVLPGRLDTKDYECFNRHLDCLSKKGFYSISFDPPGTWESPGGIELFTTTNYIKAVNEAIEYFGNRKTLLLGHSRGGATATLAGTKNPHVIGLILINPSLGTPSPPEDNALKNSLYTSYRDLPPGIKRTKGKKKFTMSLNYFKDGSQYNDAEVLKTCLKPKIIFYATKDEFITPKEVEEIYRMIPKPKELHQINCTHDYRLYPEIVKQINKEIGLFIQKYLLV
jgi:hypothetical protein